jgi:MFS family permease
MIHQVYFFRASPFFEHVGVAKDKLGLVMGIGQASEIFFLLILGFFIKRMGYKWVLVLGTAAYAARFGLFTLGEPTGMMIAAQVLHGLCYGCFFAGSFLLVEKIAGDDVRHSAQTVFGIIILGVGPVLAGFYNQFALGLFDGPDGTNYRGVWLVQAAIAAVAMLVLVVAFPKRFNTAAPNHA